jgi:DHA2 family multidrug resistance protein-like MFS transporter
LLIFEEGTAMTATATTASGPRASRREWTGLAVLALPTLLLAIDVSVLHLAAPHLSADLAPDSTELLWILDIYGFMIAGFLVTMGTLGDRIGRRKLLLIGAAAFGAASVAAAYSTTPEMLIVTRALLGIAGATLMPSTLALISNMFQDAQQRAAAIGVWMTCFMAGAAIGPVAGGLLLESFWWGSVFLLGVPVMVLLLIAGPLLLPEYRDPEPGKLDLPSVTLSLAAMIPLIYGLKELAKDGLETVPLAALVFGALMGLLFVRRQRTLAAPLMDLRLFRSSAFTAALALMLLAIFTSGGVMLFVIQYLQMVQDMSPLEAGLWMLPATGGTIVGALGAPKLAQRIPAGRLVAGGLAVTALGYLLLTAAGTGGFAVAVVALTVAFFGLAPIMVLGTDLVLGSAPAEKAGSASSLSETSAELGMALGVAVLGTLGATVYRARMDGTAPDAATDGAAAVAEDSLPGALGVAERLPAEQATELLDGAREAFTDGMNVTGGVSAALVAVLAVIAAVLLRHIRPSNEGTVGSGGADGGPEAGHRAEAAPGDDGPEDTGPRELAEARW